MKNKTRKKMIKMGRIPGFNCPNGWYLMSSDLLSVVDIKNVLPLEADVEIWEEAGVLEIVIGEKDSIDIEMTEPVLGDEEGDAFLKENKIRSLFYITFKPEKYDAAKNYLQCIANGLNCMICGDTEDFEPVITAEER